jgi:hypothetical protein
VDKHYLCEMQRFFDGHGKLTHEQACGSSRVRRSGRPTIAQSDLDAAAHAGRSAQASKAAAVEIGAERRLKAVQFGVYEVQEPRTDAFRDHPAAAMGYR